MKLEYGVRELKGELESMGMITPFKRDSDSFQRISPHVYISAVLHKAGKPHPPTLSF